MNLAKIRNKAVVNPIALDCGEVLTVTYDPSRFTPEFEAALRNADEDEVKSNYLCLILCRLLIDWDLKTSTVEEAEEFGVGLGDKVPLTLECLAKLPIEFLIEVSNKAKKEQTEDPNSKTPQSSGSF